MRFWAFGGLRSDEIRSVCWSARCLLNVIAAEALTRQIVESLGTIAVCRKFQLWEAGFYPSGDEVLMRYCVCTQAVYLSL